MFNRIGALKISQKILRKAPLMQLFFNKVTKMTLLLQQPTSGFCKE